MFVRFRSTGNLAPVDAEPSPKGNIAILDDGTAAIDSKDIFEPLPAGPRHLNHYATCPQAKRWHERSKAKK